MMPRTATCHMTTWVYGIDFGFVYIICYSYFLLKLKISCRNNYIAIFFFNSLFCLLKDPQDLEITDLLRYLISTWLYPPIDLLPFTIVSPVFSGLWGALLAKYRKTAGLVLFVSSVFTAAGIAMLGTLSDDNLRLETNPYVFEVILGQIEAVLSSTSDGSILTVPCFTGICRTRFGGLGSLVD
ncbi:uncharacterized protein BO88DRAFT_423794 [Aspergillus vadensis CBS 113365]|uniref:Uncharacterized protein n=1 Tax=Aspergillus vadensis (strain CBS 113365 / IMI 142717 / IBT 24658) TaxID=1448311 RepID=A0A319BFY2_ASPVC|nr:hypothetical protein BO88DRAFT_423794 [Aspergillus vadensis CBS 113365]PYH70989.1 hypothetical protein BO88DRAFT_423794 [Aspergillus vadensis CBS 113365]